MIGTRPRITVATAGHLATCPRMLKAADALAEAGHTVRVVSTRFLPWATVADREVVQQRAGRWAWTVVNYSRESGNRRRLVSGLVVRIARAGVRLLGVERCPLGWAARAFGRVHGPLVRALGEEPADLIYGGTAGALAAVAAAARRAGVPYALDLEDLHGGEREEGPGSELERRLAAGILRRVLPGAAFRTAGSAAIASAYEERYGVPVSPLHNTFPLPRQAPDPAPAPAGQPLRLYWLSQTVGPGRGLDQVVRAVGRAGLVAELHLRGREAGDFVTTLRALAAAVAPGLTLVHHPPAPPDAMVELARPYDIGLAPEPGFSLNNRLALSNKVFTCILAGLAVVLSATPGQLPLGRDLGAGALLYAPGDVEGLARGLGHWDRHREVLAGARRAAWEGARRRWHWEHAEERGRLLAAVAAALGEALGGGG